MARTLRHCPAVKALEAHLAGGGGYEGNLNISEEGNGM